MRFTFTFIMRAAREWNFCYVQRGYVKNFAEWRGWRGERGTFVNWYYSDTHSSVNKKFHPNRIINLLIIATLPSQSGKERQQMEKIEFQAVIRFLTKQGKTPRIILKEMSYVYGDSSPANTMVYKWRSLLKQGRESIKDDHPSGRPIEATSSVIVEKVEKLVLEGVHFKEETICRDVWSIIYGHFEYPPRSYWHV